MKALTTFRKHYHTLLQAYLLYSMADVPNKQNNAVSEENKAKKHDFISRYKFNHKFKIVTF